MSTSVSTSQLRRGSHSESVSSLIRTTQQDRVQPARQYPRSKEEGTTGIVVVVGEGPRERDAADGCLGGRYLRAVAQAMSGCRLGPGIWEPMRTFCVGVLRSHPCDLRP